MRSLPFVAFMAVLAISCAAPLDLLHSTTTIEPSTTTILPIKGGMKETTEPTKTTTTHHFTFKPRKFPRIEKKTTLGPLDHITVTTTTAGSPIEGKVTTPMTTTTEKRIVKRQDPSWELNGPSKSVELNEPTTTTLFPILGQTTTSTMEPTTTTLFNMKDEKLTTPIITTTTEKRIFKRQDSQSWELLGSTEAVKLTDLPTTSSDILFSTTTVLPNDMEDEENGPGWEDADDDEEDMHDHETDFSTTAGDFTTSDFTLLPSSEQTTTGMPTLFPKDDITTTDSSVRVRARRSNMLSDSDGWEMNGEDEKVDLNMPATTTVAALLGNEMDDKIEGKDGDEPGWQISNSNPELSNSMDDDNLEQGPGWQLAGSTDSVDLTGTTTTGFFLDTTTTGFEPEFGHEMDENEQPGWQLAGSTDAVDLSGTTTTGFFLDTTTTGFEPEFGHDMDEDNMMEHGPGWQLADTTDAVDLSGTSTTALFDTTTSAGMPAMGNSMDEQPWP